MTHGPVRFAVVGCGTIAPTHVRALRALDGRAEVVACADVVPERAAAFAREHGLRAATLDELLADPTIDAVSVCTPSGAHAEVGVPALRAGKHVVVEKPMDVTVEACDRLLAAQRSSGARLAVISQHRFDDASRLLHAAVGDGRVGDPVLADCRVPWYRTQDYYDGAGWRGTWALDGGGALMNQGIHTLDLMLWACGPVTSVYALTRTAVHDIETEDVVCATLAFASGAVGTVTATTIAYPGFPARLAVHGTRGGVVVEGDRLAALAVVGEGVTGGEPATAHARQVASGGTRAAEAAVGDALAAGTAVAADAEAIGLPAPPDPADAWGEAHRRQLADLLDAIATGGDPLVDGREGRAAVQVVTAIYQSARTGLPVHL